MSAERLSRPETYDLRPLRKRRTSSTIGSTETTARPVARSVTGSAGDPGSAASKKSCQRGTSSTEEEAVEGERGAGRESEMRSRCVGGSRDGRQVKKVIWGVRRKYRTSAAK